ncbi:MAG: hypothetical protein JXM69_11435 [Anaerolineae bacterium]|nr:hypothetical protein [Anaerolineae bacterium]
MVSNHTVIRTRLPTLTPTVQANPAVTAMATAPANIGATPFLSSVDPAVAGNDASIPPLPLTSTPAAPVVSDQTTDVAEPAYPPSTAEVPVAEISNWSFTHVQSRPDQYGDGLLLYGEAVNNASVTQELISISGTFFDAQAQIIAGEESMVDYWPIDIVPAGQQLPFELTVFGLQNAADFDLKAVSQPSGQAPQQGFEFLDVAQWDDEGIYCLTGGLKNEGGPLQEYVVIIAVLYNDQSQVINFGEYYEPEPENGLAGQPLDFEVCVELIDQEVARYELRAWGQ